MSAKNPASDPLVTVSVWHGPLTALAARQRLTPGELLGKIRRVGLKRGAAGYEVQLDSPTALLTLKRVLDAKPGE